MKTAVLFACVLVSYSLFSQVEIREFSNGQEVGNDISGTTVSVTVNGNCSITNVFSIKNVGGSVADLKISRLRVDTPPANWQDGLSWAPNPDPNFEGQCFAGGQMATNPWSTPGSLSIDDQNRANLTVEIYVDGPGCGHYRYYVLSDQVPTPLDSIDVEVCYISGIIEGNDVEGLITYPNPVNNVLTIIAPGTGNAVELSITDFFGNEVYMGEMNLIEKMDMSEFADGLYQIKILENSHVIYTRKIVVNH